MEYQFSQLLKLESASLGSVTDAQVAWRVTSAAVSLTSEVLSVVKIDFSFTIVYLLFSSTYACYYTIISIS